MLTRRDFLKTSVVGGIGLASMMLAACGSSSESSSFENSSSGSSSYESASSETVDEKESGSEEVKGIEYMVGEIPYSEYERAVWYGFINEELSENRDAAITWSEYCTMIYAMLSFKDASLGDQWKELAALALSCDEEMTRDQGCFVLYRAVELLEEEMNDAGIRSVSTNPHLLPSNDGSLPFSYDYSPFTRGENDDWIYDETYEGLFGTMKYIDAAIMYCQYRMSLCSFETLYNSQTDIIGPLTIEDAALSVLRLYECEDEEAVVFWLAQIEAIKEEAAEAGEPLEVTTMRAQILDSESTIIKSDTQIPGQTYTGTAYYVSYNGNDENDGLSPETAWETLDKVSETHFSYGDAIFFERGGTYRGNLYLYGPDGYVTLSAYGEGEKPILTSSEECAASADKWTLWKEEGDIKIWKYYKDCLDCGVIVFDDTTAGNKITAVWSGTEWINEDGSLFDIASALSKNLDFFSDDAGKFNGATDFYVNASSANDVAYGPLYLRCDEGNPGELYDCIELCTMTATDMKEGAYEGTVLDGVDGTVYDNLSIKYFPMCGICLGAQDSIIQYCEIAWGGGCVQVVDNGEVTGRMGDAINGFGQNNKIIGNYIHDVESSAFIIESATEPISNAEFSDNLIERTSNGINIADNEINSFTNVSFDSNIFYLVGVSWGVENNVRNAQFVGFLKAMGLSCLRISEIYEFTDCTISGNSMYYPLQFFYTCDLSLPLMSDNLYVPAERILGFAYIRYDVEVGPFIPASIDDAENIIQNVFQDSTSVVQ